MPIKEKVQLYYYKIVFVCRPYYFTDPLFKYDKIFQQLQSKIQLERKKNGLMAKLSSMLNFSTCKYR